MVFNNRRTYLCYNNRDLIRDGYIKSRIEKEYLPVSTFNVNRLKNPPKGVNYVVTRDSVTREITAVKEVKRLLPASKIKIEIDFSKVMRNKIEHPISPGMIPGFAGFVLGNSLASLGFGGIASGLSYFTIHLLDAETKINRKIIITEEMIETGVWVCDDGYPLSVFGIVTDHEIGPEGDTPGRFTNGLDFDENDPLKDPTVIGKYSDGVWQGSRRKRISGATDSNGLFGGDGIPEIKFDDVAYDDQPQLFDKIVRDDRKLKFRADNFDASGGKDYPFRLTGNPDIDATDRQIRLKLTDDVTGEKLFDIGDTLFITYSVALERHVRQNLNHRGDVAQGNTQGIVGFRGAIRSEVDAFDYRMRAWAVPILPVNIKFENIDEIGEEYIEDDDYKLIQRDYYRMRVNEVDFPGYDRSDDVDMIEGWRVSEAITDKVYKFWVADHRGIGVYEGNTRQNRLGGTFTLVLDRSLIRDQGWFTAYLESLDFTYPTGSNGRYVAADLTKNIEDEIEWQRESGQLFDVSEFANSLLFDREKIPYYKPFAKALLNVSKWVITNGNSGVGIINLDLYEDGYLGFKNTKELFDLSYIEFDRANSQPLKSYSCVEPFDIFPHHYFSQSYDANTDAGGMGAWYDRGHIDNQIFEWRPSGGNIESYWKLETPYFCGNYTRKSRVYTERVSGPSLDNYSWIFVDTEPFISQNISCDQHRNFDEALVVFKDDHMHYGLCYNKFLDARFRHQYPSVEVDMNRSHIREPYDHDKDFMVGQNRMLGDFASYTYGIPIVDDVTRICRDGKGTEFWFSGEIYNGASYGLDFTNDPPKADVPSDWFIRNLTVDFWPSADFDQLINIEKYVSFYFEGSESSISEVKILRYPPGDTGVVRIIIDFNYYYNGPLQFLGEFWKKVSIKSVMAKYTTVNDLRNTGSFDINDHKIESGQNAVVYDGIGRLMVFYANNNTGNIDVALSYDDGGEWIIHKNLIRLVEGESAGLPFVIKDKNQDYVHLFYTLNDVLLMYKRINTDFFVYEDAFVEYVVPISYDVDDYDQSKDDPEGEYWGFYSDKGRLLRQYPSYFIAGDSNDPYFIEQLRIRDALAANFAISPATDVRQVARFNFSGNQNEMRHPFSGNSYVVYMDDEGIFRLFMTSNGKMSVKRSNNYLSWKYDIDEQVIHKDFIDDELNKGTSAEIQNIQVVRNDFSGDLASTLYFHNGMLFIRHFQSDLLFPFYDSSGDINNDNMKKHLDVTDETSPRPIFLVGKIPENIREFRINEIDNNISSSDSELFIYFPYDKLLMEKFDERFEIDTDTQVYAYTTKTGLIRIFYKDSFGNLNGIILDAKNVPTLEVMNKFKGT